MPSEQTRARSPLSERLRPSSLREIVGNRDAIEALSTWAKRWNDSAGPPRLRAAVLRGPPGVGKTTAALALAHDMGWNVVELNASDARNQRAIEQVAGRASLSHSLSGTVGRSGRGQSRVLILLDEADCLTGRVTEESPRHRASTSFRDFLEGRYGSPSALSKAWGLGEPGAPAALASWQEIPTSPGRAAWTRLDAARRDIEEWRQAGVRPDASDRGGLGAIARLVRETRQPLILTVNDERTLTRYSPIFRSSVARVAFSPVEPPELKDLLRRVALNERYSIAAPALELILRRSRGDVRAALNDLEAIAPLPPGPAQSSVLSVRDSTAELADLVAEVLSHPRFYRSVEIRDRLDATPDDLLPWVEENVPRFAPDARHRSAGVDEVARAELLLSRARRFRVYGLWSFASELLTGGAGLATGGSPQGPREAAFPVFLGEMGRTRMVRALRGSIVQKVGRHAHLSRRKATETIYPFLAGAFTRPGPHDRPGERRAVRRSIVAQLGLTAEEVGFLLGKEPDSGEVADLLPDSAGQSEEGEVPDEAAGSPTPDPGPSAGGSAAPKPKRQKRLAEF